VSKLHFVLPSKEFKQYNTPPEVPIIMLSANVVITGEAEDGTKAVEKLQRNTSFESTE